MSQGKELLMKLADDIDSLIAELEEEQEKLASNDDFPNIGRVGARPSSGSNPMMDFLFSN